MLEIEFAQISHPGSVRDHNEDYLGHAPPGSVEEARSHGWLFALADGVGGQDRGEVASRLAVETLLAGFRKANGSEPLTSLLSRLIQAANAQVFEAGLTSTPGRAAMATTIVASALRFDRVTVAHAGDSRCYLIRQGYAVPLTRDHTVSSEQLRLGLITSREAASAQTSHLLSRALGNEMFLTVETSEHQIFPGDSLLLCSDGLHHSVEPDDIVSLTAAKSPLEEIAAQLIALANQRDGSDNISVQLIRVQSVERVGIYRGRHYKIQ
ncbi:MAG: serine/threonine-protein phosphatase [Acidobacteriaceae bacterium]|nr:serine/threonine-protein phosphatase [Acidobacteriaceae bacterium]